MPLNAFEKIVGGAIVVLALWAYLWLHAFDQVRGPLAPHSLSERADRLQTLPADWQAIDPMEQSREVIERTSRPSGD